MDWVQLVLGQSNYVILCYLGYAADGCIEGVDVEEGDCINSLVGVSTAVSVRDHSPLHNDILPAIYNSYCSILWAFCGGWGVEYLSAFV